MDERQALLAIRNAIRLEQLGIETAAKVTPLLLAAFKQAGQAMKALPPGAVERQIAYKQLRLRLAGMFKSTNDAFYIELRRVLNAEVYYQVYWSQAWLNIAEAVPKQMELGQLPHAGLTVSLPTPGAVGVAPAAPSFALGGTEITRTQLYAIAQETEVLGKRMEQLFGIEGEASVFIRDNINAIDRQVKIGFITGQTNEEIAKQIVSAVGHSAKGSAKTVARTAVMDMSHRAHEAFWDANASVIAGWEFDATMDYRACVKCAPWDGRTAKERSSLPSTPIHPNCRCRRLPLTETEVRLRKAEGPQQRSTVQLIEARSKGEAAAKARRSTPHAVGARAYAAKVRDPKTGKRYWKVAVDIKQPGRTPTMADFLLQASEPTQINVLGSRKARTAFIDKVTGRKGTAPMSPDQALREVLPLAAAGDGNPAATRSPRQAPAVRRIPRQRRPR